MNLKETDSSEIDEDLICLYPQVWSDMADPSTTSLEFSRLCDYNGDGLLLGVEFEIRILGLSGFAFIRNESVFFFC